LTSEKENAFDSLYSRHIHLLMDLISRQYALKMCKRVLAEIQQTVMLVTFRVYFYMSLDLDGSDLTLKGKREVRLLVWDGSLNSYG